MGCGGAHPVPRAEPCADGNRRARHRPGAARRDARCNHGGGGRARARGARKTRGGRGGGGGAGAARGPSRVWMEAAGPATVQVLLAETPGAITGGGGVLVAAGAGNNGGDGWVIARALHAAGIPVWVAAVDPKTDDAIDNRALARLDGVRELGREEAWPQATVAVDSLLGTGAVGPAKGDVLALAQRLVEYGAPTLAVDGPTGL